MSSHNDERSEMSVDERLEMGVDERSETGVDERLETGGDKSSEMGVLADEITRQIAVWEDYGRQS